MKLVAMTEGEKRKRMTNKSENQKQEEKREIIRYLGRK